MKFTRKNGESQLILRKAALTSVCIDIIGEFIRMKQNNEYVLVITVHFQKLPKQFS